MNIQLMVSKDFAGRLIGSKGSRINGIRSATGAQLKILSEEIRGMRQCNVGGSPMQVGACLQAMFEPVNDGSGDLHEEVEVHVPSSVAGKIIGKGGENIKQIRLNSGCQRVQMERTPQGSQEELRKIECSGLLTQLSVALLGILESMDEESGRGGGYGPPQAAGGKGWGGGQGRPPEAAGGKGWGGGEGWGSSSYPAAASYQAYQAKGGCSANGGGHMGYGGGYGGYGKGMDAGWGKGGMDASWGKGSYGSYGKDASYGKGQSPPGNGWGGYGGAPAQPLPSAALIWECSNETAGALIGKAGVVIKGIREGSGAKFKVEEAFRGTGRERCCIIDGTAEQVDTCLVKVFEVLGRKAEEDHSQQVELTLLMPQFQMGCIIGSGGSAISKIRSESGARIKVDPGTSRGKDADREANVSGSPEGVCQALRAMVRQLDSEGKLGSAGGDAGADAKRRRMA